MNNPSAKSTTNYLKIGAAAKALGVSIDTLRRWERAGKITTIRTPGGTRLYSVSTLKKLNPSAVEHFQATSQTTEELLKKISEDYVIASEAKQSTSTNYPTQIASSSFDELTTPRNDDFKRSFVTKFLISSAVVSAITFAVTSWITASYLTHPQETAQFFKNNVASGLLSPLHKLAEETVAVISPKKAQELGFAGHLRGEPKPTPIAHLGEEDVLATTASPKFLEVNADTQINGNLDVRYSINGLSLEGTPSASTITLASGDTTLSISDSAEIDQDVSTTSSPTFTSVNAGTIALSATTNQLSSGSFQFTLPGATTTLVGTDTTQTLTKKSLSGSANTFTNIPNSALVNSKVTVTAGTNLTGGGDITLGSSVTLAVKGSPSFSGQVQLEDGTAAAPSLTFASDADTGLYRISSNSIGLITGGTATSGITINGSGNVGIGTISPTSALHVVGAGNFTTNLTVDTDTLFVNATTDRVGIGASVAASKLSVGGNVGIGFSFANSVTPANGLAVEGNVGIGITTANSALTVNGGAVIGTGYNLTAPTNGLLVQGLVGVGTTAPGATLSVNGGLNLGSFASSTGPSNGLAVSGNVGIGTTSPSSILHIIGNIATRGNVTTDLNNAYDIGTASMTFRTIYANEVNASTIVGTLTGGNLTADTFTINSNNETGDAEDANLRFHRGTASPHALLTWDSTTKEFDLNSTLHLTGTITSTNGIMLDSVTNDIITPGNETLALIPGGTGNVGINTTSPYAKLQIRGAGTGTGISLLTTDSNNVQRFAILDNGNIGIGVTNPSASLTVHGNVGIGFTNVVIPTNGLAVSGNVGVGTTSPLQALHVVGQCVAEGTVIRRRRRKKKKGESDWEDIPVEDIKPGDIILTFDESSGQFIPSKVEKTMAKGIQEVIALTTSSNKRILTTKEHPYLCVDRPLITQGTFEVDQSIKVEDLGRPTIIGIAKVNDKKDRFTFSSSLSQQDKKQILRSYQKRNRPELFAIYTFGYGVVETFKAANIYPARVVIDIEYPGYNKPIEDIIKMFFPQTEVIFDTIGKQSPAHVVCWEVNRGNKKSNVVLKAKEKGSGHKALRALSSWSGYQESNRPQSQILSVSYYTKRDLSRAKWKKVNILRVGQYIATIDGFEKITGIQIIKRLPTYDLQIENTHNFVGNNIVAHNTYVTGNVGLGVTTPGSTLSINGNSVIGYSGVNIAGPSSGLAVSGNVGVGTTSPLQALHVVGQCVTGDTKLRRRKRKKNGTWTDEYEDVEIKDIKQGDQILSLNEKTGTFEPHQVKDLMDMGRQDVYQLITQTGKKIRTTGTHPYLIREIKTAIFSGTFEVDQSNRIEALNKDSFIAIANRYHRFVAMISKKEKKRIHQFYQKTPKVFGPVLWARIISYLVIKNNIKGAKLILDQEYPKYEKPINQIISRNTEDITIEYKSIGHKSAAHLAAYSAAYSTHKKATGALVVNQVAEDLLHPATSAAIRKPSSRLNKGYHKLTDLSSLVLSEVEGANWIKVYDIKLGSYVATTDGWEKIISLKKVSREQTFDIEVENTHNFVGNNIVAHNTYVTGNVGLGVTTPGSTLSINGNSVIGYSGVNIAGPSSGLAVSGNVGIGITTANSNLSVAGSAHIGSLRQGIAAPTDGLFVDGNVGIGATSTAYNLDVWGTGRFSGAVTVAGNLGVGTSLTVDSAASLNTLNVSSISNLSGNVGVGASLTTTGLDYATGGLRVNGFSDLTGNVGIGTSLTVKSASVLDSLQVTKSISAATLGITGVSSLAGNVGIGSSLTTTSAASLNSLNVVGVSSLTNTGITGTLTVSSTSSFGNNLTLSSGQFLAPNGTSSLPSYSFTNSTSTGLYSPSVNALALNTNGTATPALTITAAGNVGVGFSQPATTLGVSGNVNIGYTGAVSETLGLAIRGNVGIGTTTPDYPLHVIGNVGIGGSLTTTGLDYATGGLRVNGFSDLTGNVGIGTSLTVTSNTRLNAGLTVAAGSIFDGALSANGVFTLGDNGDLGSINTSDWDISTTGDLTGIGAITADGTLTLSGVALDITTGTNETLTIIPSGTGNVGIGTSNAGGRLIVIGQAGTGTGNVGIGFTTPTANLHILNTGTGDSLRVDDAANDVSPFVISSDGNVGIANSAPSYTLDVIGSTRFSTSITQAAGQFLAADGTASAPAYSFSADTDTGLWRAGTNLLALTAGGTPGAGSTINGLSVNSSGNVGIGITNPTFALDISSTAELIQMTRYDAIPSIISRRANGTISAPTAIANNDTLFILGIRGYGATGFGTAASSRIGVIANQAWTDTAQGSDIAFDTSVAGTNSGTEKVRITGAGNVGIGTTGPGSTLAVVGNSTIGFGSSTTTPAGPSSGLAVSGNVGIGITTANSALTVNGGVSIGSSNITAPTNGLFVLGNVGIGFTSPDRLTQIASNIDITSSNASLLGANGTQFGITGIGVSSSKKLVLGLDTTDNFGVMQAGNTDGTNYALSLNPAGGNVGIGITTANSTLVVAGNAHIGAVRGGIAAPANGLFVDGNVGIGATTSSNLLDVWGNTRITGTLTLDGNFSSGGGVFLASDGTASAPAYSFSADTNSGLYRFASDGIALITGGASSNLLSLNSSGNVGIGTTSPNYKLTVKDITTTGSIIGQFINGNNEGLFISHTGSNGSLFSVPANTIVLAADFNTPGSYRDLALVTSNSPRIYITSAGNVGIGTTGPGSTLAVVGNSTIGYGSSVTSPAGPSSGLAVSGNVGVGTTSPLQALHVVGQCVTGDTKLRRRKRSKGKSNNGVDEWDDVRIDQIKAGDEILTLDEASGQFVPSTVKGLMDMGIQKTYLLITESGKSIRTTAEHPYLVRSENLFRAGGLFEEGNIDKKTRNQEQGITNTKFYSEVGKINHPWLPLFLNLKATDMDTILNPTVYVNNTSFELTSLSETNGVAMASATQPAARLTSSSDNIIKNTGSSFINNTLPHQGEWIKVSQIKAGMEVATIDGWEKISSIKEFSREQVWDIEVENTHNFVGNNIVAHNTYITGNVGLGVTTPGATLSINGNSVIGYSGVNIAGPSSGLAVSGNVGIGTTSPLAPLQVQGNGTNSAFFLNGNIGIGTTVPSTIFSVVDTSTSATRGITNFQYSADSNASIFQFLKSRGTPNSPSAVQSEDVLGHINFSGYTGASFPSTSFGGARIRAVASENWSSTATGGYLEFATTPNTTTSPVISMVINQAGNIGIGFTSPDRLTQIASDIDITSSIASLLGANGTQFAITGSTANNLQKKLVFGLDTTNNYGVIQVGTGLGVGNTAPLSLNPAGGNIGIGTTNPQALLHVGTGNDPPSVGSSATKVFYGTMNGQTDLFLRDSLNDTEGRFSVASGEIAFASVTNHPLTFYTNNGTTQMILNTSGNLGIGFTSPDRLLQVALDANPAGTNASLINTAGTTQLSLTGSTAGGLAKKLVLGIDTTDNFGVIQAGNTDGTNYALSLNPAGGNVGIGTTTTNALLDVRGAAIFNDDGADADFRIESDTAANAFTLDAGLFGGVGNLTLGAAANNTGYLVIDSPAFTSVASTNIARLNIENTNALTVPTGTTSIAASVFIGEPNLTATGTINNAVTLYIEAAPTEGGTNNFALWVDSGASRFDGGLLLVNSLATGQGGTLAFGGNENIGTTEYSFISVNGNQFTITGALTNQRFNLFDAPSITAATSLTVTNAATVYITGPPTAAGSAVITNAYALWVDSGTSRFDGNIDAQGNVGIGFTSPDRLLQIGSNIDIVGSNSSLLGVAGTQFAITGSTAAGLAKKLVLGLDTTNNYGVMQAGNTDGTNYSLALNPAGGNVGIGTTSPSAPFEVKATGTGTIAKFTSDNTTGCTLADGGTITCTSDINLKKNIEDLSYGLDDIMKLYPVGFNWKGESDATAKSLGFIAQEVEGVIPKLVSEDSNGLKELNTIGMVPILTKAIQQQQAQIASQSAVIASASATISNLDSRLRGEDRVIAIDLGPAKFTSFTGNVGIGFSQDSNGLTPTNFVIQNQSGANVFSVDSLGNIKTTGTVTSSSGAFDLSEDYTVLDETIEAGDVVTTKNTSDGGPEGDSSEVDKGPYVEKSTEPYQQNLIGIISTNPGVILSGNTQGRAVALAGRVPVKVSTENGPIEVGDYLTSSSTPGVAMKATRPGPTVGKALEAFDCSTSGECQGKILAFINVSFADPGNFFASLSFDDQGNLIVPKLKVGSLILDSSVASASAQLTVGDDQLAINIDPNDPTNYQLPTTNYQTFYDLSGKIASLEERITELETAISHPPLAVSQERIANSGEQTATSSATPSADLAQNTSEVKSSNTSEVDDLDLTPPDILLYQDSAILSDLAVLSEATVSGQLTAYQAEIQDNFRVFGETQLSTTAIAGDLTVDGTLSIENGSEINVLTGPLYLQRSSLAGGLDIFDGKISLDRNGTLKATSIIANQLKINENQSAGSAKIPAGATEVAVENPYVEESSIIIVTPDTALLQTVGVVEKKAKTATTNASFRVTLAHPEAVDISFDYLIIGISKTTSAPISQAAP